MQIINFYLKNRSASKNVLSTCSEVNIDNRVLVRVEVKT